MTTSEYNSIEIAGVIVHYCYSEDRRREMEKADIYRVSNALRLNSYSGYLGSPSSSGTWWVMTPIGSYF